MLLTIGDLVEDVVVSLGGPVRIGSDTNARIERRRGGSASNTAAVSATLGHPARFVGRVGDDAVGAWAIDELAHCGVDVSWVQRGGRTGTIVVLVDDTGERTMLPDRAASLDLDRPDRRWLDGVSAVHVPLYSFTHEPLSTTTTTVVGWARAAGIDVSVDVSSSAVIEEMGVAMVHALLVDLEPDVVFANEEEAAVLSIDAPIAGAVTVVKRGPDPLTVFIADEAIDVPVPPVQDVVDTTGAGDAFSAGYLGSPSRSTDPVTAALDGCRAAAALFATRG